MGLPKIQQPIFEDRIPSTGVKIKSRPFTVKEEKILLIAQESGDAEQIILAIKQILNNCIIDDIDIEKLAMFDIEYLLLKIRAQSVNNVIKFSVQDPDTEEKVELSVDINTIELKKDEKHSATIDISNDFKLTMRYPSLNELIKLTQITEDTEDKAGFAFDIMVGCIDSLIEGEDTVYKFSEYSKEEVDSFVESLTSSTVNGIREFFDTIPRLRIECPYVNSKGDDKTFVVEGIQSFFI
jgi:hypothetical protein